MRILITGANGLIGRVLAKSLKENNHTIFGMDCAAQGSPSARFQLDNEINNSLLKEKFCGEYFSVDICDQANLKKCLDQIGHIDLIIHLAALMEIATPEEIHRVNIVGTENIFHCMETLQITKIIYASSIQTIAYKLLNEEPYCSINNGTFQGNKHDIPKISVNECIPNQKFPSIQMYVESKFFGEALAKQSIEKNISSVIMRLGAISSNDQPYEAINLRPIWCSHRDLYNFIDKAIKKLFTTKYSFSQTYYVCSNHNRLWVDMNNDLGFVPQDNSELKLSQGKGSVASFSVFNQGTPEVQNYTSQENIKLNNIK